MVIKPPASDSKPVVVAKVTSAPDTPPAAHNAPKKTAAVTPPSSGANGYVVVLASVPASGDSRLSALRKFADMQQKYGAVLQSKTPDVQEANLGARGIYHRLLVGPPGSRSQASTLCSDLKAAGYKDCWVMAY
jgi:cell division septation protein DedD